MESPSLEEFIERWRNSGAAERANYGLWPAILSDEKILTRPVALNAEERRGHIRWLRPEQNVADTATQTGLDTGDDETSSTAAPTSAAGKRLWPKTLAEQAQAVRAQLTALAAPADAAVIAAAFRGARADRIEDLLETLASLGQARLLPPGAFVAQ